MRLLYKKTSVLRSKTLQKVWKYVRLVIIMRVADVAEQAGAHIVDVHPDLQVIESNRVYGNTDPRFGDPISLHINRAWLFGRLGCERSVVILPKASDVFHDVDRPVLGKQSDYNKWRGELQPRTDTFYCPVGAPKSIDLPGDGLITSKRKVGLMLNAADCAPVLLYDPEHTVLGLAHIGRNGALLGIGNKVLDYMKEQHEVDPANLVVYAGAAAGPKSHIIEKLGDPQFKTDAWEPYVHRLKTGYAIDFLGFALQGLREAGVPDAQISSSAADTFTEENFFSFDAHKAHGRPEGRNSLVAMINY